MATTVSARSSGSPRGGSSSRSLDSQTRDLVSRDGESKQVTLPEIRPKSSEKAIDKTKPLPTSLQSDFLPDEVLLALTHPAPPQEKLGPPTRYRNLDTSQSLSRKRPANVWNFPKRREQFKHLTDNTTCVCGAGRDISFLYDVPKPETELEKPEYADQSGVRAEAMKQTLPQHQLQLPDTLIPEEYHVVKNKGVMGLEFHEDKFTSQPVDHEQHLVVFPSMNPTSRYEVLQLKKAMDVMMEKIGANDDLDDVQGATQMHQLLELIKKEQNIYNAVFHELIRQVSVECLQRGQLLSELRSKYSEILNKVPKQVKGLHEEVMAQRALDRRLTEELMRFKSTIGALTSELSEVKEHDKQVTQEAKKAQEDLKSALLEAQKNSGLLGEYHELYELQRQRLETQVNVLAEEKEIWSKAAYSLALKVIEEHSLNTAKRLHVSEKAWAKLAKHFTIRLSDADTTMLTQLQQFVESFREQVDDFNRGLKQQEEGIVDHLVMVRRGLHKWIADFEKHVYNKDGLFQKAPDNEKTTALYKEMRNWEEVLSQEGDSFSGDEMLTGQEALYKIRRQMDGWTDVALKVFNRHQADDDKAKPEWDMMSRLNEEVDVLLSQFQVRLTGENGVARGVIGLANSLESWTGKLNGLLQGGQPLPETEWTILYQLWDDWVVVIDETLEYVGQTQKQEDRDEEKPHTSMDVFELLKKSHKWLSSTINSIDSEDAKLVEQVSSLHTEMVKWMVQMLLRLAPDKKECSQEAAEAALLGSATVGQLQSNAKSLFDQLTMFTTHVASCCMGIVSQDMQVRLDKGDESADQEYRDLQQLKLECDEWIHTAKIMLTEMSGEALPESLQPSRTDLPQEDLQPVQEEPSHDQGAAPQQEGEEQQGEGQEKEKEGAAVVYTDQEKLETPQPHEAGSQKAVSPEAAAEVQPEAAVEVQPEVDAAEEQGRDSSQEAEHPDTAPSPASKATTVIADTIKEEPEEEQKDEEDKLEILGYDESTHYTSLQQNPNEAPKENKRPLARKFPESSEGRAQTPDTQKAYEALAAVDSLQSQLIATEERAQAAEERAANAEAELVEVQERVRALERRLQQATPEGSTEATEKPAAKPKVEASTSSPAKKSTESPAESTDSKEKSLEKERSTASKKDSHSRSSSRASSKSKKK